MVVVDNVENVRELQNAAARVGTNITVLIDLDIGQNRTGIEPGEPALRLAEAIGDAKSLRLAGICAYAGHSAHVVGFEDRRAHSQRSLALAIATRDLLRKNGHPIEILSGASTGTYNIDSYIDGMTEMQSGSYVFMDVEYRKIGGSSGAFYEDFMPALCVLATVVHRSGNKAIVDAGLKAFSTDRPYGPEPFGVSGVVYDFAGDEHGRLKITDGTVRLGDRLRFIIPHCDPTVNLYDRFFCVRGEWLRMSGRSWRGRAARRTSDFLTSSRENVALFDLRSDVLALSSAVISARSISSASSARSGSLITSRNHREISPLFR
jgi:D-serine deaminase-like pyridoxal phosphate-dependent protein